MRIVLGGIASALVWSCAAACTSGDPGGGVQGNGDCSSFYEPVASAPSWPELREAMLRYPDRGRLTAVRIQAHGSEVGIGDQGVVRVVDLLGPRGRRRAQVEVWRTGDGGWSAGIWNQCID